MIWFTADLHLNHGNIIKYCNRPFLSASDELALKNNGGVWHRGLYKDDDEASDHVISNEAIQLMNDTLIFNINRYVCRYDQLRILGDFVFAKNSYETIAQSFLRRINCQNISFIIGNHDNQSIRNLLPCWDTYLLKVKIPHSYEYYYLNHYANFVWPKSHRGSFHLYGHSHGNIEDKLNQLCPHRKSMDVGVDNANKLLGEYRPFSIDEIRLLLKDRNNSDFVTVDPNTKEETC